MEYKGFGYRNLVNIRTNISTIDEEEEVQEHKPIDLDFDGDKFLSFDKTKGSTTHSSIYKHRGLHIDRDDQSFMNHSLFSGRIQPRSQNYSPGRYNNQRMHHNVESSDSTEEITRLFIALSNTREDRVADKLVVDTKQNDKPDKSLQLSEAEKDRSAMQKHELLIEEKGCCGELLETISDLKEPEANNSQLVREFDWKEKILSDLELKYRIIAKDDQCGVVNVLKEENCRHRAQTHIMQQEISSLRNQLEQKELEVKHMQAKYNELQKSHTTIVEKNAVRVRELQSEVYENQRSNANASYENLKLKKKIDETLRELTFLSDKFNNLTDSDRFNNDESFEYFKKNRSSLGNSTPTNYINEKINRLKEEAERTTNALQASGIEKSLVGQFQLKIIENKHLILASVCLSVLGFLVSVGTLLRS